MTRRGLAVLLCALACSKTSSSTTGTVVSTAGGTVQGPPGGPSLAIPADAVGGTTTVTVTQATAAPPPAALSPIFAFGPTGTVFNKPVAVNFDVPAGSGDVSIYWSKLGNENVYEALPTTVTNGTATASNTHFSNVCLGPRCTQGTVCPPSNPCHVGAEDCSTGTRVCKDTGNAPDGTSCGTNQFCHAGVCGAACNQGTTCTSLDPCHTAAIECSSGSAVCTDNGNVPDGTSCGGTNVCTTGVCGPPPVGCTAGQVCTGSDPCKTYTTSCAGGASSCVASGNASEGADCSTFSQFTGSWSGDVTETQCGGSAQVACGPLELTLSQSGSAVTGTAVCHGPNHTDTTSISGSASGGTATLNVAGTACSSGGVPALVLTCTGSGASLTCTLSGTDCQACGGGNETPTATSGRGVLIHAPSNVCSTGSCIAACTPGAACTPQNQQECKDYAIACNSTLTQATCAASDSTTGTSCTGVAGGVCLSGSCVHARTVTGHLTTVYEVDDGGTTTVDGWPPEQNGATVTGIAVPDSSDAGYFTFPVTLAGDSSYSVPGVPVGTYYLQVDAPTTSGLPDGGSVQTVGRSFYQSTASAQDLSVVIAGRADRAQVTQSTPVNVQITGLAPWVDGPQSNVSDLLRISSSQGSLLTAIRRFAWIPGPPNNGDTSIDAGTDWMNVDPPPYLPDAAKGDVSYVYQRRFENLNGTLPDGGVVVAQFANTVTSAKVTDFTVVDGVGGTLHAAMSATPQTGTLPGDYRFSQFAALAPKVNPAATPSDPTKSFPGPSVIPMAYDVSYPNEALNAALGRCCFFNLLPNVTDDVNFGPIPYGQFFDPALWHEDVQWVYGFDIPMRAPGGTTVVAQAGDAFVFQVPMASLPSTIAPTLGPVSSPLLNGADAFTPAAGVGSTPVISWSAPTLGTVTHYNVVVTPQNLVPQTGDISTVVGVVFDTSWKVPGGFLRSGGLYSGSITAINSSGAALDAPPFRNGLPAYFAPCDFGLFSP